jgi:hypothetical protein
VSIIRKYLISVTALVLFASTAVAQVPEFNVVPSSVDEDLSAYNQHDLEFTFSNQDGSEDIYNLTLENSSYLSWDTNNFRVNASESRTVNASFYTENITEINDTIESSYKYSGSDNAFSGENISIEVSTFYENTSVNVSTFKTDFELEFGESDSSVFSVDNTGGEQAFQVELEGEDISFDRGGEFTVPAGEDELVGFDVSIPLPEENATEATNRTYERTVTVSGANFNETEFTVSVFVPFQQYDSREAERTLVDQFIEFCSNPENSDSVICSDENIVEYRNNTKVVNNTPVKQANISQETEEALQILAQTRSEDYQDILDRVKLQQNTFRSELETTRSNFSQNLDGVEAETERNTQMIRSLNQTIVENNEEELEEARSRTFWVQVGVFVLFVYLVSRGIRWLIENWEELTEDVRW